MGKRILIATGGTGGHIYPAVALAQQLKAELSDCSILFVGGGLETNKYFDRSLFDWRTVACGKLSGWNPLKLGKDCLEIAKGVRQSRAILRAFKPDAAVGFGSYYSLPPMLAAKWEGVPVVLHESNSIPGKVNKLLAPWAYAVGVQFPQTLEMMKGNCFEVGVPLRMGYKKGAVAKEVARKAYGLDPERKTLLSFGGSQGARAINRFVLEAVEGLPVQVIHIAGDELQAKDLEEAYRRAGVHASVKIFEQRMDLAWQAADCVVCRSGAGTIGELFEFEVPALMIPFPRAADNHQEYNADFIASVVRGGAKVREAELDTGVMARILGQWLQRDGEELEKMRLAMKSYKQRARCKELKDILTEVL